MDEGEKMYGIEKYINRLDVAQSHFDWASDPGEVDVAIYEIMAAELALSNYVKGRKNEEEGVKVC